AAVSASLDALRRAQAAVAAAIGPSGGGALRALFRRELRGGQGLSGQSASPWEEKSRYTQKEGKMFDFNRTGATATPKGFAVNAVIVFMDISRFAKLALALAVGLWIGLSAAAGAAGMIAISKPFPVVGIFVALPLLAAAIATGWPAARTAMLSVPMPLMIG